VHHGEVLGIFSTVDALRALSEIAAEKRQRPLTKARETRARA